MSDIALTITKDTATPALARLSKFATQPSVMREMAKDCATMTRSHVLANGTNKQGWPSTGFYKAVAGKGIRTEMMSGGFSILIDHPEKPGSMRQRYYGGTITMKDKLLTIPARAEFYGHSAGEFTNLRFGMFRSTGTKFLYIDEGGSTRGGKTRKGIGARAALMVAYWLKESVDQVEDKTVIPDVKAYADTCMTSLRQSYAEYMASRN